MPSIYDSADIYDLLDDEAHFEAYKAHWKEVIGDKPIKTVLDVSIGSGTVTIPLFDLGVTVTGSDLSERMLENCKKKMTARGITPDLKCADFRDLSCFGERKFDLVASTGNSLAYVSNADACNTLKEMDKHVNAGGYIYIDIRNWDKVVADKQRFYLYNPFFVDDSRINFMQVWDHNPDGSITFNLLYTFEKENKIYRKEQFEEHYNPLSKSLILNTLTEMGYHDISVKAFPAHFPIKEIGQADWFTILAKK